MDNKVGEMKLAPPIVHESYKPDNSRSLENYLHSLVYQSYLVTKFKEPGPSKFL